MTLPLHGTGAGGLALVLLAALGIACAGPSRPPAASGSPAALSYSEADVRFMQGMIHHHAQALAMTALVPSRTETEAIRRIASRIEISQRDEIARMRRWLTAHDEALPGGHFHGALMPGMLSPDQMAMLEAARGAEFDRLFLELMIQHHEGALVMVRDLVAEGGGHEPQIYVFTTDVDADQRAEIARMRGILDATAESGSTPEGGRK